MLFNFVKILDPDRLIKWASFRVLRIELLSFTCLGKTTGAPPICQRCERDHAAQLYVKDCTDNAEYVKGLSDVTYIGDNFIAITVDADYSMELGLFFAAAYIHCFPEDTELTLVELLAHIHGGESEVIATSLIERHKRARTCPNITKRNGMLSAIARGRKAAVGKAIGAPDALMEEFIETPSDDPRYLFGVEFERRLL
jgi:hypothetical protein